MTSEPKRNLPASVRQRLLTLSERRKEPYDLVLVRYGIERLLYRLSRSPHAEKFLLKGAMLFAIWSDGTHRPTRDVDLLGFGPHAEAMGQFSSGRSHLSQPGIGEGTFDLYRLCNHS